MSAWTLFWLIVASSLAVEAIKGTYRALWPRLARALSYCRYGRRISSGKWEIRGGQWIRKARCAKYLGEGNYCMKRPGHFGKCNYA